MSDSPRVKKIKSQCGRLSVDELGAIITYCRKRQEKIIAAERVADEAARIARIKSLPIGARVLIKFGARANHKGEITKHGRKYVYVALDNGENWRFVYSYVDDRVDDSSVKRDAALNATINGIFSGAVE